MIRTITITEKDFRDTRELRFYLLRELGYFEKVKKALEGTFFETSNLGQESEESIDIYFHLETFLNAKDGDDLTTIHTQIAEKFKTLKLKNLQFDHNASTLEIIDSFWPQFTFENLKGDIQDILFDIKTLDYFVKGLDFTTPTTFALKESKKDSEFYSANTNKVPF